MVQTILKSIFGGVSAGLGALTAIMIGTTTAFSQVSDAGWVTVASAVVVTAGVVWGVPNADKPAPAPPSPPAA